MIETEKDKENWYEDLINLIPDIPRRHIPVDRFFHRVPPRMVKLVSNERKYLYCPTQTCSVLRRYRMERLELTEFNAEEINLFIFMVFPYHSSEHHQVKETTPDVFLAALDLTTKLGYDRLTSNTTDQDLVIENIIEYTQQALSNHLSPELISEIFVERITYGQDPKTSHDEHSSDPNIDPGVSTRLNTVFVQ